MHSTLYTHQKKKKKWRKGGFSGVEHGADTEMGGGLALQSSILNGVAGLLHAVHAVDFVIPLLGLYHRSALCCAPFTVTSSTVVRGTA